MCCRLQPGVLLPFTSCATGRPLAEGCFSFKTLECICSWLLLYLPVCTVYEQESLGISAVTMLKEELAWLEEVQVPSGPCASFQTLLAGHLQLCRILFTCEGVDKQELGGWRRGGGGGEEEEAEGMVEERRGRGQKDD